MNSDFTQTPYPDMVQRALAFEPRERTLHANPLSIESLPARGLTHLSGHFSEPLVSDIGVNDGLSAVSLLNGGVQLGTRVPLVRHDVLWVEVASGVPSLTKQVGHSACIVGIASTDVCRDREFIFSINRQMQFPAERELSLALSAFLHRPASLTVRVLGLTAIDPSSKGRGVQGYPLPEPREFVVAPTYQLSRHILQLGCHSVLGQPSEEPRERGLMRNEVRRGDTTCLSDEGVVLQGANERSRGFQTEDVSGDQAMPEDFYWMPLGAATQSTPEGLEQGFVFQGFKDALKLGDDWRCLNNRPIKSTINVSHWKLTLPAGQGTVGVDAPAVPALFCAYSVSGSGRVVNRKIRIITINYLGYATIPGTQYEGTGGDIVYCGILGYAKRIAQFVRPLTTGGEISDSIIINISRGWDSNPHVLPTLYGQYSASTSFATAGCSMEDRWPACKLNHRSSLFTHPLYPTRPLYTQDVVVECSVK